MKKTSKTILLSLLIALLVMSVAGCGKKVDNSADFNKNTVYKEEALNIAFPSGFEGNNYSIVGDKVVFYGYAYNNETYESKRYLGSFKLDGTDLHILEMDPNGWIESIVPLDNGNLFTLSDVYYPSEDPDEYGEDKYMLQIIDGSGKVTKELSIKDEFGLDYMYNLTQSGDLFTALGSDGNQYYFDSDIKLVRKEEYNYDNEVGQIIKLKDDSFITRTWGDNGIVFKRYDSKANKVGDLVEVSFNALNYTVSEGAKCGYDLLLSDNSQYLGYNIGDAAPTPLINFVNSDIVASYFNIFEPIDEKTFFGIYTDYDDNGVKTYVSRFVKVNPEDVKEKQVLTLGLVWLDNEVKKEVIDFNKANDDVRIVIKDYQQYVTDDDYMASYKKLNSDIATGQGPDILYASYDDQMASYAKKGLFLDLYSMMDKDEEINKEDFCQNVLELLSQNGKLYFLSENFSVRTVIGKKSLLNNKTSWTLDEMIQLEKSLPEGTELMFANTREGFLSSAVGADYKHYVDEVNGKCNFDNEDFIKLLEYTKTLPEGNEDFYNNLYGEDYYQNSDSMYRENKVVLSESYIYSFNNIAYTNHGQFGEPVSYIGYPCSSGNGSGINFSSVYAINARTANKEAAWKFVRTKFTPEAQSFISWMFPINEKALRKMGEEATIPNSYTDDVTGEVVVMDYYYYMNGMEIKLDPLNMDEVNEIIDFILSIDKCSTYVSEDISEIITEEVAPFYNNQKSAAEVAKIVQSRVSIMLAEKQ